MKAGFVAAILLGIVFQPKAAYSEVGPHVPIEDRWMETNGIHLHVVLAGPEEGSPALLLHGFPEYWRGWAEQIDALAGAGYRVIAPDQRGYNLSDKPSGAGAYRIDHPVDDALGLLDALHIEKAAVIGHDWGGVVAWWLALRNPERVSKLVILNSVHPLAAAKFYETHPSQFLKSWYVFLFEIPGVPELYLHCHDFAYLAGKLLRSSLPGTFSEELLALYREAWSQPGALHSMIQWYRRIFDAPTFAKQVKEAGGRLAMPVLILWGRNDSFLDSRMAQASLTYCPKGRVVVVDGATHWLHHERPDLVNSEILNFLHDAIYIKENE